MICRMFAGSTILAVAIIAAWPTFAAEGIPKKLFNGSTLEGWSGDPSHWSVVGLVSDNHRESRSYRDKSSGQQRNRAHHLHFGRRTVYRGPDPRTTRIGRDF